MQISHLQGDVTIESGAAGVGTFTAVSNGAVVEKGVMLFGNPGSIKIKMQTTNCAGMLKRLTLYGL